MDELTFGTVLLIRARERSGLTKDQVASQLGVPVEVVDGIEALGEDSYLSLVLRYAEIVGALMTVEIDPECMEVIDRTNERGTRSMTRKKIRPPGRST